MKTTKTPIKITVNRTGAEAKFELATEDGIGFLLDHLPEEMLMLLPEEVFDTLDENVTLFYGTADREFLIKVRDLIDDAIRYPRETDTFWTKFRRTLGLL